MNWNYRCLTGVCCLHLLFAPPPSPSVCVNAFEVVKFELRARSANNARMSASEQKVPGILIEKLIQIGSDRLQTMEKQTWK